MKLLIAVFAFLSAVPVHASVLAYSDWSWSYETSEFTLYEYFGPDGGEGAYDRTGQTTGFDLYLQLEGLYSDIPDGTYDTTTACDFFSCGDFYTVYSALYDEIRLSLTFAFGEIIEWSGYAVYSTSSDGLSIDSEGFSYAGGTYYDSYFPFYSDANRSISPGTWTLLSQSQNCYDTALQSSVTCVPSPIPLPASSLLVLAGLGSLFGYRRLSQRRPTS